MSDTVKLNGTHHVQNGQQSKHDEVNKPEVHVNHISEEDVDPQCGIGSWKMPYLNRFATAAGFTGFFLLPQLVSQSLTSYINSQIPSLEKQFSLSSYESGVIMTFNDIGFLLVGFIAASIPKLVHVPRWLFSAIVIFAISGLLCSLPHFIIQATEGDQFEISGLDINKTMTRQPKYPLCTEANSVNATIKTGSEAKSSFIGVSISPSLKSLSVGLIGIGMGLQGVGKSIRTPFLTQYIDGENKQKTGFYVGILTSSAIFGPVVAYMLGGVFSRMYVTLEDIEMSPKDPRWIGAWWLGFIVFGILALVVAFPIVLFPRKLKAKTDEDVKVEENPPLLKAEEITMEKTSKMEVFKERCSSYIRVFKSPVYVCLVIMFILHISSVLGPIAFKSKYIEAQFGIPLWKANMIISGSLTATVSIGTLFSGYITKRFKLTPRQLMILVLFLQFAQIVFHGSLVFIGCDQPNIIGPGNVIADAEGELSALPCKCDETDFFPICGSNDVNYYSPCFAGCSEAVRNGIMYKNCTRIPDGVASAGLCPFECNTLIPYIVLSVIGAAFGSLKIMPLYIATIRSVEDRDKSTAAGLKSVFASLLAFIPTPIIFGKVIDTACIIWNTKGQRQGSCSHYNLEDLRTGIFGTVLMYKCAAVIFILIPLWKVWKISDWSDLTSNKTRKFHK